MSIATDLQAVHTGLQGVLNDCNTALVNKGGAEVTALNAIAGAITALPSGESGDSGETPATGGAVNGTRYEATINMSSATYTGSCAFTAQPSKYLVKLWVDNPETIAASRLVCAYVLMDSSIPSTSSKFYCVKYYTNTGHTEDSPVYLASSSSNLPTFDGTTFSWNVGTHFNAKTDYHLVVIDLSNDL